MAITIGVQLHPQHGTTDALLEAARRAEEAGADRLWTWDHFYPLYGDPDGAHFECFTTLAAFAVATSKIELGPLVACASYRNPNLLADMARTIDHLAGGDRFVLGIGAGCFERDYVEYGFDFAPAAERIEALKSTIACVRDRWAKLNPHPTRNIPVLIGGSGPRRTLPLVASVADEWHCGFPTDPQEIAPSAARLRDLCDDRGRAPGEIRWSVGIEPHLLTHDLHLHAERYVELGFTGFSLGVNGPDYDLAPLTEWLEWRDAHGT